MPRVWAWRQALISLPTMLKGLLSNAFVWSSFPAARTSLPALKCRVLTPLDWATEAVYDKTATESHRSFFASSRHPFLN
jgi:hypothetical protein